MILSSNRRPRPNSIIQILQRFGNLRANKKLQRLIRCSFHVRSRVNVTKPSIYGLAVILLFIVFSISAICIGEAIDLSKSE